MPSDFGSSRQKSDSGYGDSESSGSGEDDSYEGQTGTMSGSEREHYGRTEPHLGAPAKVPRPVHLLQRGDINKPGDLAI